ncbi:hypothetical protein STREPTOSP366_19080 [Streptomyces variabilis]
MANLGFASLARVNAVGSRHKPLGPEPAGPQCVSRSGHAFVDRVVAFTHSSISPHLDDYEFQLTLVKEHGGFVALLTPDTAKGQSRSRGLAPGGPSASVYTAVTQRNPVSLSFIKELAAFSSAGAARSNGLLNADPFNWYRSGPSFPGVEHHSHTLPHKSKTP